jgi:DNA-binding IclR family transcriptional regulator
MTGRRREGPADGNGSGNRGGRRLRTVNNALGLLHVLSESGTSMGVSELASRMSLGKSTVHLLLQTLCDGGFTEAEDGGRRYRLGLGAFEVGAAALEHLKLGPHLDPPMERLAGLSKEAVSLAIRSDRYAVIVKRFESTQILRAEIRLGTRMLLHSSASGKCLIAELTRQEIDELYPDDQLPQATPRTIKAKAGLLRELEETRRRGYALNVDEFTVGVAAVAVPVRDKNGKVRAGLSIAGPTARFDALQWLDQLQDTADEMAHGIGLYAIRSDMRR